jgi:hypothetical protein
MVVCLASAIQAQDEQRGRGQRGERGRGGFGRGFGGFGGGIQQGAALELMGLLQMQEVRTEVGIEEEIWNAIPDEAKQVDFRSIFQASEEERTKLLAEANEKAKETLDEVLEPEKQKRLMGLLAQRDGYRAAANDLVAKEIGLDEAGLAKVKEAVQKANDEMREAFGGRGRGQGGRGGFDPEALAEMRTQMEEMRKKADETIAASLTDEQKQNLENLKGAKFEFPEPQFGRGRGFGGPGGPGGRGPGGGRPGNGDRPSGNDSDN